MSDDYGSKHWCESSPDNGLGRRERFAALKEEYLAHQNKLNTAMILEQPAAKPTRPEYDSSQYATRPKPAPPPLPVLSQYQHLDYPPGRLLFLRNVPTTTNKTAIRADITAFLGEHSSVDYVDWSKGHDTVSTFADGSHLTASLTTRSAGTHSAGQKDQ